MSTVTLNLEDKVKAMKQQPCPEAAVGGGVRLADYGIGPAQAADL